MSPESICQNNRCNKKFYATTKEDLLILELEHHKDSLGPVVSFPGSTSKAETHHCREFYEFDLSGILTKIRKYSHGYVYTESNPGSVDDSETFFT